MTKEKLDMKICDDQPGAENTQTYREFIHESYKSIDMSITDEQLDTCTDKERDSILDFADEIWFK